MARRTSDERQVTGDPADDGTLPPEPGPVTRRAPFSDNPNVGARGQRTQQRILDAALRVFGEEGFHQTSIDRIAKQAGCSRVSFYQYFSSKEDVFRNLTGQIARQLQASTEALEPVTADRNGWNALRAWIGRHTDIYTRYEPVFRVFQAASESDEAVAVGSARWSERHVARIRSSLVTTRLPPRQLDPELGLLNECLTRTLDVASILRTVVPDAYPRERVEDAFTDVMHRSLFGLQPDVNVHPPARKRPPMIPFAPGMWKLLSEEPVDGDLTPNGRRTLEALLEAGRDVFVQRGYHGTRVDDVVSAAGVSHGAFYRYFENKDQFARLLTAQAIRRVSTTFAEIPELAATDGAAGRAALRRWLRRYYNTHSGEATMIRVWVDAAVQDVSLRTDSAAAIDWGRRRMAAFLRPRHFGDVDFEAIVMVTLVSAFGARQRSATDIDAAAHIIEGGLLGR